MDEEKDITVQKTRALSTQLEEEEKGGKTEFPCRRATCCPWFYRKVWNCLHLFIYLEAIIKLVIFNHIAL